MIVFLQVVLVVLKLAGVIAWPWLAVLAPVLIGVGLLVVPFVFVAVGSLFVVLFSKVRAR